MLNSNKNNQMQARNAQNIPDEMESKTEEIVGEALNNAHSLDVLQTLFSRRTVMRGLSAGALAVLTGVALTGQEEAAEAKPGSGQTSGLTRDTNLDLQILNFALHAEYLEGEFYSYSFTGQGMTANGIDVTGVDQNGQPVAIGPTTGGIKINFTDPGVQSVGQNVWQDELKHIVFIRSTIKSLGGTPIAKPPMNLAALATALNIDPASQANFLIGGRSFCDTGTSAYAGTSKYLTTPAVIQSAGQILAVEAFHASALRLQMAQLGVAQPPLDPLDVPPPPTTSSYFTVDPTMAFAVARSARQVLNILFLTPNSTSSTAGGFYPSGVYGNIAVLNTLV